MRNRTVGIAVGCVVLAAAARPCWPASGATGFTPVAAAGTTRIAGGTASLPVEALVTLRPAGAQEAASVTRCSGGRTRCALVDALVIRVGASAVDVPPRAALMLSDVNRGKVMPLGRGGYELALDCGDGGAAYRARLFFDRRMVRRLEIWDSEAGRIEAVTTYRDLSHAFR